MSLLRSLLFALLIINHAATAQQRNEIVVAFYNCENFFDTEDDPLKDDDEFTPAGKFHYTQNIYEQRQHNMATVIQSMNGGDGPAIMGLAEVENGRVLSDLTHQPEISRHDYHYILYSGPDPRGINVALLYDPKLFHVIRSEPVHVDLSGVSGKSLTRDILHVFGTLSGDSVHIFVSHWPSRRGGVDESNSKRAIAARVERHAIDEITKHNPSARIILMGDFNDNPVDNSIASILEAKGDPHDVPTCGLFDPWVSIFRSGGGTEVFRHSWNLFDQIIISGSFLQNRPHGLHYDKAGVYKPAFLIDHYKGHEGEPYRSFVGTHWIHGYSDHFPVILYLSKN